MKKLFCLILFGVFLILCGCDNTHSNISAITKELKFTAKIEYNKEIYEFHVQISKNSKVIMQASAPERIKDSVFEIFDDNVIIRFKELEYKTSLKNLPPVSPISFIYDVFNDASKNKNNVIFENNEYFVSGKTDRYEYKLFMGNSGLPIKIIDNKNNISAIIKQAAICKN